MFDDEINSSCDSENETYGDFKFRQMCKELWEDITQIIIDFLDSNKDENEILDGNKK